MTGVIPASIAEAIAMQDQAREADEAAGRFIDTLLDDFDDRFITGYGTGEPLGFLAADKPPTPAEKAIAILAPHLAHEPLYQSIGTPL